jgi:RNA polymerase sigma-70 factor (ECF subfamily)
VNAAALTPAEEEALISRLRARTAPEREAAFSSLFKRLREPVLALCLQMAGSRGDAEDALQETFIAVHRLLPDFRGEARLTTWIYRIAVRVALRIKCRVRWTQPLGNEPHPSSERLDDEVGARREANATLAAMARLPAQMRAVLVLFALDGMPHKEIADVLGVPEGTVWSRLHQARKRLVAELQARANPS